MYRPKYSLIYPVITELSGSIVMVLILCDFIFVKLPNEIIYISAAIYFICFFIFIFSQPKPQLPGGE